MTSVSHQSLHRRLIITAIGFVAAGLLFVGCGTGFSSASDSVRGRLIISAASSLQGAFQAMEVAFEHDTPAVDVTINFGASSTLGQQILNDAPVDVFASADEEIMGKISAAKFLDGSPKLFATNSLEILVRKGNPLAINNIADLAQPGLIYVTCAPEVPIGNYGAQALKKAGVSITPASFEPDVKGIVSKVASGEADAGIVYATDVQAANGAAEGIAIPAEFNLVAKYPIAALSNSSNLSAAEAWISFVIGHEGQRILSEFGFEGP